MDLRDRPEDETFRKEVRAWLSDHVVGEFAALGGRGGSGDETFGFETRLEWEKVLAADGWTGIGWPVEHGGRGASIAHQVIFNEEYVRAKAPGRVSVLGEGLLGPTLIQYGTPEQQARFLPPILAGTELWCQGYSEPDAGSDLANVQTKAQLDGDEWVVTGQKVWTSLAHQADWCFVVCRTEPGSVPAPRALLPAGPHGPARRGGPTHHPADPDLRVQRGLLRRGPDPVRATWWARWARDGRWPWPPWPSSEASGSSGTSCPSGGSSTVSSRWPGPTGRADDPVLRQRLARSYAELEILRYNTLRSLSGYDGPVAPPEASVIKLYWATWHRQLGELALDVRGPAGLVADGFPYELDDFQRTFLFSRSETIYGGSNEIQKNIIGERVLGLPPEPKGTH